jgi:hypothetical protein
MRVMILAKSTPQTEQARPAMTLVISKPWAASPGS